MKVSMVEVVENYWTGYIILENHFQVNNASQIGLSYEQKLRDGIKMTLSTNLDGTKLNEPGHKLGLAIEMEA